MALNPGTSFRQAGLALAAIAGLAYGGAANAQTAAKSTPVSAPATQTVSKGNCDAFFHYVADELRAFRNDLSKTFIGSVLRFHKAGCAATDKDGPVYIITMTNQDDASLRTSLSLMGKFDIIGVSGVKGCHRPEGGTCPATVGSTTAGPRTGG